MFSAIKICLHSSIGMWMIDGRRLRIPFNEDATLDARCFSDGILISLIVAPMESTSLTFKRLLNKELSLSGSSDVSDLTRVNPSLSDDGAMINVKLFKRETTLETTGGFWFPYE